MDNITISGIRIYLPCPGEKFPIPSADIHTFAIKGTTGDRCCVLGSGMVNAEFCLYLSMRVSKGDYGGGKAGETEVGLDGVSFCLCADAGRMYPLVTWAWTTITGGVAAASGGSLAFSLIKSPGYPLPHFSI